MRYEFRRGGVAARIQKVTTLESIETGTPVNGRSIADWMSAFATCDMDLFGRMTKKRKPAPKSSAPAAQETKQAWVEYGNWSDEHGPMVSRMVALATGSRAA